MGVSPIQVVVGQVWSDVLEIRGSDPPKNFFDLGGDSLKAIEVISRLQALLHVELPLIAFFEDPTIVHLAAGGDELRRQNGSSPADIFETQAAKAPACSDVLAVGQTENAQNLSHIRGALI